MRQLVAALAIPALMGVVPVHHQVEHTSCNVQDVVSITHHTLYRQRIYLPEGPEWIIHARFTFILLCDIKKGAVTTSIQRHDRYGKPPHWLFRWNSVAGTIKTVNLDGKKRGLRVNISMESDVCVGIANYRMRVFWHPGIAGDGKAILMERDYYPNQGGERFNCK